MFAFQPARGVVIPSPPRALTRRLRVYERKTAPHGGPRWWKRWAEEKGLTWRGL